jgi:hypothetical protein
MHYAQAWNEAVCSGAWGARAARWGERIRRSQDLDHWSSFHRSFTALTDLIRAVRAGKKGQPPASIVVLSGDVHHGYLAEATFRDGDARSPVYQAVCSLLRNSLPGPKSRLQSVGWTRPGELAGRFLARLAGIGEEGVTWRLTHDKPWFENQISTLTIQDRRATLTFRKAVLNRAGGPNLEEIHERRLA